VKYVCTEEYALFKNKVDLFQDFSQKLIFTYLQFYRIYSELYERTVYFYVVISGAFLNFIA
jgi:hypothetical protein